MSQGFLKCRAGIFSLLLFFLNSSHSAGLPPGMEGVLHAASGSLIFLPPLAGDIPDLFVREDDPPVDIHLKDYFENRRNDDDEDDDGDDDDDDDEGNGNGGPGKLTFSLVNISDPALFREVDLNENSGRLRLIFQEDAFGRAEITVRATNRNNESDDASFSVILDPVNDRPSFEANDPPAVEQNSGAHVVEGWAAFDPGAPNENDQQPVYLVDEVSNPGLFSTLPGVDAGGTLRYTLREGESGESRFEVRVRDNGGDENGGEDLSLPQTFVIKVTEIVSNDPPVLIASDPPQILEDAGRQEVKNWASYSGGPEKGKTEYLVENIAAPDLFSEPPRVTGKGDLIYRFRDNAYGSTQFEVRVRVGEGPDNLSEAKTFNLEALPVNDRPSFEANDPPAVEQNSGAHVVEGWAAFDPGAPNENDQQPVYLVDEVSNPGLFSTLPEVDADGALRYTLREGESGESQFEVRVRDNGGDENGGEDLSLPQTFAIKVTEIASNDPPVLIASDPPQILEDAGRQEVKNWASYSGGTEKGKTEYLVENIAAPDLFSEPPRVTGKGDLIYRFRDNAYGSTQFEVRVRVGEGPDNLSEAKTFNLEALPVNDRPSFEANDPPAVEQNSGAHVVEGWAAFDPGAANENDQQPIYLVDEVSNPGLFSTLPEVDADGTLRYTLREGESGKSQFEVRVRDNGGDENGGEDLSFAQTFEITVSEKAVAGPPQLIASDPPQILEDAGRQEVTNWASYRREGPGNPAPTFLVENVAEPQLFAEQPKVTRDGDLIYRLKKDAYGSSQFDVRVSVGGGPNNLSEAETFEINALPVNDRPSFDAGNPPPVAQNAGDQTIKGWATFNPGAENEFSQVAEYIVADIQRPDLFTTTPRINASGDLNYEINPSRHGTSTFSVRVKDNGGNENGGDNESDKKIFKIEILEVDKENTPPFFLTDPVVSVAENSLYEYKIRADDKESSPEELTIQAYGLPDWLVFYSHGNGSATLSGSPQNEDVGTYDITLVVSDGGKTARQEFTITVLNSNNAPYFTSLPVTGAQIGSDYRYLIAVDDDDQNDELTIEANQLPGWLDFEQTGSRSAELSGSPVEDNAGSYSITLKVTDQDNQSAVQEFKLFVNNSPVSSNFSIEMDEDNVYALNAGDFRGSFRDLNDQDLESVLVTVIPEHGALLINGDPVEAGDELSISDLNSLTYAPDENYFGSDQFSWQGSDGLSWSSNTAAVAVTVNPVNDPPELINIESEPLTFAPNKDEPKQVTHSLEVIEVDGDPVAGAVVIFSPGTFQPGEDSLIFEDLDTISGLYSGEAGILTLSGSASGEQYQEAIRSIRYQNISANPTLENRRISIYVEDAEDASAIVSREIQVVEGLTELVIPTAITPNEDGANDVWVIENLDLYPDCVVRIFTRTGKTVYSSSGYQSWDGTFEGKKLPEDVYYYIIDLPSFNKAYSGAVTLIR